MSGLRHVQPVVRGGYRAGFTLIELLVAATITVLIAGMLVGLIATTLAHWDRTTGALTAEAQARGVLDWLEQDLKGAWNRNDGNAWLVATIQPAVGASGVWENGAKPLAESLSPATPDLMNARFGIAGVWLRFFTNARITTGSLPAPPAAVSYQIVRRASLPPGSMAHYQLYRSEVAPAATLAAGYDLASPLYLTASDLTGSPGNLVRPDRQQVLGDNVIDFGVRLFAIVTDATSGTTTLRQIFPLDAGYLEYRVRNVPTALESLRPFPTVVEVLIRVLTPEGARAIAALEAGRTAGNWWTIAAAHSRVVIRRITVSAGAP